MGLYARDTAVPVERSRAEIEGILSRYGASAFGYMTDQRRAVIQFQANDRRIRFVLPLTDPATPEVAFHLFRGEVTDRRRAPSDVLRLVEQGNRQRWRALALAIKAKLEAVQAGITVFGDEFMAHIVMPNGKTVSEVVTGQVQLAYDTGKVQPLLAYEGGR